MCEKLERKKRKFEMNGGTATDPNFDNIMFYSGVWGECKGCEYSAK